MLEALGGGCLVPVGVVSEVAAGVLNLRGSVLTADGTRRVSATHRGPATAPLAVGQELGAMLLAEGAGAMLLGGGAGLLLRSRRMGREGRRSGEGPPGT